MMQSDARRLLEKTQTEQWTQKEFIGWLIEGFSQPDDSPTVQAFLPLIISPMRERTSQVISSLLSIAREDEGFNSLTCISLETYLDNPEKFDAKKEHVKSFWYLYGSLGDPVAIEEKARASLAKSPAEDVARAIVSTMITTKIAPEKTIGFLKDLKDPANAAMNNGAYWYNLDLMTIMDSQLGRGETIEARKQISQSACESWEPELSVLLDASKSSGRICIRSIARQIEGNGMRSASNQEPVDQLKASLFRPGVAVGGASPAPK